METWVWSPESSKNLGVVSIVRSILRRWTRVTCGVSSLASLAYSVTSRPMSDAASKSKVGAGEVAPWLKALAALLEDPGSVPATTRWLTALSNSSSRRANTRLRNLLALGVHMMCRHTYCRPNIYTQKKINPPLKESRVGIGWRMRPEVILWPLCTYEHGCALIQPQAHVHRERRGGMFLF